MAGGDGVFSLERTARSYAQNRNGCLAQCRQTAGSLRRNVRCSSPYAAACKPVSGINAVCGLTLG